MTAISLTRLAKTVLECEPFEWGYLDDAFDTPEASRQLMLQFPDTEFCRMESRDKGKRYAMSARRVHSMMNGLTGAWREFLRSLEAESYRRTLSKVVGVCLDTLQQEITLCRYHFGDHLAAHTDKRSKVVTQIYYFSEPDWVESYGGCLDILASDDSNAVVRRIAPVCGNSVVVVRSDRSWHAVTPHHRSGYDRCAVQVVFHRDGLNYSYDLPTCEGRFEF